MKDNEKFKKVRTENDIRKHPAVDSLDNEGEDGWFCNLKSGYIDYDMECGIIHEHTISEVCNRLNNNLKKV